MTTKSLIVKSSDGSENKLKIDLGNQTVFPIQYEKGSAPTKVKEIALSLLNTGELKKTVGDKLTIFSSTSPIELTFSGIYFPTRNDVKKFKSA